MKSLKQRWSEALRDWRWWTLVITIILLLCITVSYGGDRKNIHVYNVGKTAAGHPIYEHFTLLDPGECDDNGCVIYEHTTQGGLLYQWYDKNGDGVCDKITVWKRLEDPTWGTFYTIHSTKTCKGSL